MDQESEGVSRTPRYLKEETSSMGDPAKTRGLTLYISELDTHTHNSAATM